jgi:hypothetical protein
MSTPALTAPAPHPASDGNRRRVRPDVEELRVLLASASQTIHGRSAAADCAGLTRRMTKLARQLLAGSRLLGRGGGLDCPPCAAKVRHLARYAVGVDDLASVDSFVHRAADTVVDLHAWRGHAECARRPEAH